MFDLVQVVKQGVIAFALEAVENNPPPPPPPPLPLKSRIFFRVNLQLLKLQLPARGSV